MYSVCLNRVFRWLVTNGTWKSLYTYRSIIYTAGYTYINLNKEIALKLFFTSNWFFFSFSGFIVNGNTLMQDISFFNTWAPLWELIDFERKNIFHTTQTVEANRGSLLNIKFLKGYRRECVCSRSRIGDSGDELLLEVMGSCEAN